MITTTASNSKRVVDFRQPNFTDEEVIAGLNRAIKRRDNQIAKLRKEVFDKTASLVGVSVLFCVFFLAIMLS